MGALISLQKLKLSSYFNMIKIETEKRIIVLIMLRPVLVLCALTSCSLVDFQDFFGMQYSLHLQERQRRYNVPRF